MRSTEQQLAGRLKKDDTAALEKIIDGFSGYVCTVIRNFSRGTLSEQDIDELCADVFFRLWEHRESLDVKIGLKAYLSAISRNAVKNRFRTQKPPSLDISDPEITGSIVDSVSIEDQAELNEAMEAVDKAMKTLSERDREIFLRFYFYGEKSSEIAKITGITESSVRSRLSRIRTKLKDFLTKRGFDYV